MMGASKYEVKIGEVRENKLLGRKEINLEVNHVGLGTLSRKELRKKIADMFKVDIENVYVTKIETLYGAGVSRVRAHIYYDMERGLKVEPEHIIRKNRGEKGGEGGSES